jgi:transposase
MPSQPNLNASEIDSLLTRALETVGQARSAGQVWSALPKALRPAKPTVEERLTNMARDGRVYRWPGGRSPHFALRPYSQRVREQVLDALSRTPMSEAQLRKIVGVAGARELKKSLVELVGEGRVHVWPRRARQRGATYATTRANALDYMRDEIEDLLRGLQKRGFTREQLLSALARFAGGGSADGRAGAPDVDPATRILQALHELNPQVRQGALVYLPHLRHAVSGEIPDKLDFDRLLLSLFAQGKIELQSHAVPAQINAQERDLMIPDGHGSYYMAIGLRV